MTHTKNKAPSAVHFKKPLVLLITGASGSGKTTTLKALKNLLRNHPLHAECFHFDDKGVPTLDAMIATYGSPEAWQKAMTHDWLTELERNSLSFSILEGSFRPSFLPPFIATASHKTWLLVCLKAARPVREKRLIEERSQPELATQDMENFSLLLERETLALGGMVLDTSTMPPTECAETILRHILSLTEGVIGGNYANNQCK